MSSFWLQICDIYLKGEYVIFDNLIHDNSKTKSRILTYFVFSYGKSTLNYNFWVIVPKKA